MSTVNNLDYGFKKLIASMAGGENIMNCYLCGTCTASCPVSELDKAFSPRKIMRMSLLGMKEELLSSKEIWKCVQCHVCVAHCPQDARPADVIRVVREIAVDEGVVSKDAVGRLNTIEEDMKKLRLEKISSALQDM